MKKLTAILLALAMLLSLAACGGSTEEDPNAGKYLGTTAKAFGMVMPMTDIYEGETWLELKSGGRGTIMLDGDSFPMKWSLDDGEFTLTIDGEDSVGTLEDGVIIVDLMDMGVEMTFVKEGMEPPAPEVTYNDAGYWEIIRVDSDDPESAISEEDMAIAKEYGVMMYMELFEDGTGILFMDEEMPLTWVDGSVTLTADALTVPYTVENGEMVLDMFECFFVLRKGEKPEPVVSEMEQAGFTDFMEIGVPYAYTTVCSKDETKSTTAELIVTSYEIFEEADGYAPLEGYEWRVVKMEVRFYDENAREYGVWPAYRWEDYYNTKLHDDTEELVEETEEYDQYCYTVIYNGEEMDAYTFVTAYYGDWYTAEAGNREIIFYYQVDFLVPVGYDGCVAGVRDKRLELLDGTYITDYDPSHFLLFRAD